MSQERVLAAIMFTDLVGYTALMGKDSAKALELVHISKEIQKPLVEKHHGKWLKEMGDGAMAQFNSALDAVNCALEIQRLSRADLEADLRIGIHSGDITIEIDDVYGDGVNVASRLESIADPGGIYVSDAIQKAIKGQSDVQAKYLGEVKLKNVDYDVRTYALQGVGLPIPNFPRKRLKPGRFKTELKQRDNRRPLIITFVIVLLLLLITSSYILIRVIHNYDHNHYSQLNAFTFHGKLTSSPTWSPDGKWLVYSSNDMGPMNIWKKSVEGGEAIQLTSSLYPDKSPAWSPDNRSIIFERDGFNRGLFQISVNGGNPTRILNYGSHPSWSLDGSKIAFDWQGSIYTYNLALETVDTIVTNLSLPPYAVWLPDNERIIYWNSIVGKIFIVSTKTKEKKPLELIPAGEDVTGLSINENRSKLIYSRGAFGGNKGLWEVSLDLKSGQINGVPHSIRLSITEDVEPSLSPDGMKIAFTARNIERHLYRIPLDRVTGLRTGESKKLTNKGKLNYYPYIAENGNKLLMTSHMGGKGLLYTLNLGTNKIEKVTEEWGDSTREVEASMGKLGFFSLVLVETMNIFPTILFQ